MGRSARISELLTAITTGAGAATLAGLVGVLDHFGITFPAWAWVLYGIACALLFLTSVGLGIHVAWEWLKERKRQSPRPPSDPVNAARIKVTGFALSPIDPTRPYDEHLIEFVIENVGSIPATSVVWNMAYRLSDGHLTHTEVESLITGVREAAVSDLGPFPKVQIEPGRSLRTPISATVIPADHWQEIIAGRIKLTVALLVTYQNVGSEPDRYWLFSTAIGFEPLQPHPLIYCADIEEFFSQKHELFARQPLQNIAEGKQL